MAISLKNFRPFDSLPVDVLDRLECQVTHKTFVKDSYVFTQGQRSFGHLFLVISGLAEIIIRNDNGVDSVVEMRRAGEFFGETVILTDKCYPASVKVVEDLTCYLLNKGIFENLLQNHLEFGRYFSHFLTDRLRDLYKQMVHEQSFPMSTDFEPFKKRVVEIMSPILYICSPDTPINQVARMLTEHAISSVVVVNSQGNMIGLVRERDLIAKVLALDSSPNSVQAEDVMQQNPATLPPDAFFYQALLTMINRQGKYIVVIEQNKPIGIVTIGDLTRVRNLNSYTIGKSIDAANNAEELAEAAKLMRKLLIMMISEKAPVNEIMAVFSELNDGITRRLIALAEDDLFSRGFGLAPVDYCWLNLGSGGRKEQTLASDQDNAIIYSQPAPEEKIYVEQYLLALAEFVTDGLEQAGYEKCRGGVMATNLAWCKSLNEWKETVHTWTYTPTPDSIRLFTIFLDFRPIYGQFQLSQELRAYIFRLFQIAPGIINHLVIDALSTRVPLNLLGQVKVERNKEHRNEVDLKKAACVHIVDCIRAFAIREGIEETNTFERLTKLVRLGVIAEEDAEYFEAAMQSLMMFRIRENLRKQSQGLPADNYINPNSLSKRQKTVLKESFAAIQRLQSFTSFSFQINI